MRYLASLLFCFVGASAFAQSVVPAEPAPSALSPGIGYPTVQAALEALQAKPGVQIQTTKPDAWTIANEPGDVQWSFTPSSHSAYPAVVRRAIKMKTDGGIFIEMSALCQAEKAACDKLIADFKELNERIGQSDRR
ncbi:MULTISPECIES: hypothetical protein [unclassified Polaromonas]|jgi:hypothetical protein|uniref:hypothetical protein n=1 Tax=unclassified Polaromonas TaxID=2638319 RepID=UPI0025E17304|nr:MULTISPECIES: hypothetical protein [unclassified Polaromonas]HQS00428.1 hypothetical protein [Polaromonas sp.]HQS41624.1 hypothetical protein [Polaromonas sp.]HQS87056.1 hypothetical protein [Polaromonas sp.]HQT08082.1 hypothetical protein [Polaromonas sp.]